MTGSILTEDGKKLLLYRGYTQNGSLSAVQYLPASKFKIGAGITEIDLTDTDIETPLPITAGTVNDDGSNTFTGSSGGDNSTDNTSVYKEGANLTDATAQNLIANDTSATKVWTIADLTTAGSNCDSTKYTAIWLYILDATTLAKFVTSGTALELRIGADTTTNYYSLALEAADLDTGWNLVYDGIMQDNWTSNGTPGTLNDFAIIITTNNATDTFVAGDVVYDLLRQWEATDLLKDFVSTYPVIDFDNLEVTTRCYLNTTEATGFLISKVGDFNEDTVPLMTAEDFFTPDSKSSTDEFAFVQVDRII